MQGAEREFTTLVKMGQYYTHPGEIYYMLLTLNPKVLVLYINLTNRTVGHQTEQGEECFTPDIV